MNRVLTNRQRRFSRGQALVEFALILPLFLMVLTGIIVLGVVVFYNQQLSNAAQLLKSGNHVVLDFQANTKAGRRFFRSVFEQADAAHVLHFVQTSDQLCLERIAKRNIERPEGSHHLTEEVFALVSSYFQVPEAAEGFNIKVHGVGAQ